MSVIGSHDRLWAESAQRLVAAAGRNDVQGHDLPRTLESEIAAAQLRLVRESQRIVEQQGVWARFDVLWEQLYCVRVDYLLATAKIRTLYSQPPVVVTRNAQHLSPASAAEPAPAPAEPKGRSVPGLSVNADATQVA